MKICLISTGYPPEDGGGIGTYIYNLSQGLQKQGHQVFVITQSKDRECFEEIEGVKVYRYTSRYIPKLERFFPGLAWSYFVSKKVKEIDRKESLDVIEFPNWEGVAFCYLLNFKRKAVVVRVHTPYFETLSLDVKDGKISFGDKFVCWMEKQTCHRSNALVSSTICHRDMIADTYKIKNDSIKILPLGIKLVSLNVPVVTEKNDKLKVLYVSRLENRKGAVTLIDAIPKVLKSFKNVEFILIGKDRNHAPGGVLHQEYFLENYSQCKDNVRFLGFVSNEELNKHYHATDVFAVPSVYESFGLIYVEAMMHKKPVIGCRAGGIPEVVVDQDTGILTKPDDVDELVEAILRLLNDDDLRLEMGRKARKLCEEKFSYEIMAKNTQDLYQKVSNERSK